MAYAQHLVNLPKSLLMMMGKSINIIDQKSDQHDMNQVDKVNTTCNGKN